MATTPRSEISWLLDALEVEEMDLVEIEKELRSQGVEPTSLGHRVDSLLAELAASRDADH